MSPEVTIEAANATSRHVTGCEPCEYTWGPIEKGSCTMLGGTTWTLFPDGTAILDATVSSGRDAAAWVIWHVDLFDRDGTLLGSLVTEQPVAGDARKFVRDMPNSGEQYRFRVVATFDAALWQDIASMKMYSVDLVAEVREARRGDPAQRVGRTVDEPGHQLVAEVVLAPVHLPGAGAAGVLDGHPVGLAAELAVLGERGQPGEQRVRPSPRHEQPLAPPQAADSEDVAHLVGDHVARRARDLHVREVDLVERHFVPERQRRPRRVPRQSKVGDPGLPKGRR